MQPFRFTQAQTACSGTPRSEGSGPEAERMAGRIEHDPQPTPIATLGLVLGFRCAAGDRPRDAGGHVLDPDVEVHLHTLCAGRAGPDRTDVVRLELDLDLGAAVGRTKDGPPVTRRVPRP